MRFMLSLLQERWKFLLGGVFSDAERTIGWLVKQANFGPRLFAFCLRREGLRSDEAAVREHRRIEVQHQNPDGR